MVSVKTAEAFSLRKHAHEVYRDFVRSKHLKISLKHFDIFNIVTQSIHCRYTLDPSDSKSRGPGFDSHKRHRVVSLSKAHPLPTVLVKPRKRWLRPDMTEKLLTGTLSLNTNEVLTSTQNICFGTKIRKIDIPLFCYIKVGFKGGYMPRTCNPDA